MIVVDCSAIVDALTGGHDCDELRALLAAHELHAPALLDVEVVSALRGMTLGGAVSEARAKDALTDFAALPIRRWAAAAAFRGRMFDLRTVMTAYDATYVVLAEALPAPFLTCDQHLARAAGNLVDVWTA